MKRMIDDNRPLTIGLLAGLAGGAVEVAWVGLYSGAMGTNAMTVAEQVTTSLVPAAAGVPSAPLFGIAIHMLLSAALGIAFAATIWRLTVSLFGAAALMTTAAASLALVWAINFFIVLPLLNPAFITLLPYGVTLASKVLFGIAMGSVMLRATPRRAREPRAGVGRD